MRQALEQLPYGPFRHGFSPLEVLGPEALESIHDGAMTILEGCGLRVLDPEARAVFGRGGFDVDDTAEQVRLDRAGVLELVGKCPGATSVRGRDPAKRVAIGGGFMAITAVGGPPFVSDLDRGRRAGNRALPRWLSRRRHHRRLDRRLCRCSTARALRP